MSLVQELPLITEQYKASGEILKHNNTLFNIYEGNLLPYILDDLRCQLSEKAFEQAKHRVAPINVLKRLIDKLSKIYSKTPQRTLSVKMPRTRKVFDELTTAMDVNTVMNLGNEFFNLHKYCAVEPYLDRGMPAARIIPADRFLVLSTDRVNPLRPTHFSKIMGTMKDATGQDHTVFFTYSDDQFLAHDEQGNILTQEMARLGSDGGNPLGRLPVTYINRSRHEIVPQIDTDTLAMTKLLPVILTDINYAVMFQCFSMIYGIDIDDEGIKFGPNAFLRFKSDPASGKEPKIGVIKPEVDSDKVLALIKSMLAIWMQTRNIKPGSMDDMTLENAASGVAKIMDEMDTSEDRKKQVPYFMTAEADFFDLVLKLHPTWIQDPEYKLERTAFPAGFKVSTQFAEQRPNVNTSQVIIDQKTRLDAGLQTRKGALQAIEPDLTEDEIKKKLAELDAEKPEPVEPVETDPNQDPNTPNPKDGKTNEEVTKEAQ
jgi:hypothetical protein